MKKIFLGFLLVTSLCFAADNPQKPSVGGTGVSNADANTLTASSPMVFPDDINLQYAYEHTTGYPVSKLVLPSGGALWFANVSNETVAYIDPQYGIYSEVGYSGIFNVGAFGIGINTVDDASTFFSVSPTDNSVGFGTLPYPDFNTAAEGSIDLTHAPKGLTLYNIDTSTLDVYDGGAFRKILSTNHINANNNATATDNGDGTVTIGTTGLALNSFVVHNTGNETIAGTKTFSSTVSGNISGNAATATNGVVTTGSYADPAWITSLSAAKLSGTIPTAVLANIPKITVTSYLSATTTTYTTPTGVTHICVQGWGGGGGGGGISGTLSQSAAGSGGGGGASFYKCVSSPLSSYAVVVGGGGAGGASGGANNGSAGTPTTFGTAFLTAGNGSGGTGSTSSITAAIVQGGGNVVASGGDLNATGSPGGAGITVGSGTTQAKGGDGGAAALGGSSSRGSTGNTSANGTGCGGGGAGAVSTNATSRAGGNGADGCLIIYEFYNG